MRGRIGVAGVAVGAVLLITAQGAGAVLPSDPQVAQQQPLQIIRLSEAIDRLARPLIDVPVALPDTGLDLDHPDIAPRLFSLPAPAVAPCQADYVFAGGCAAAPMVAAGAPGWDLIGQANGCAPGNEVPDADPTDPVGCSSHGTAISGVLGAAWNNGLGGAGVAPNARFIAIRSCWDGDQCYEHVQPPAIRWAVERGARVVSLSFVGNPGLDQIVAGNPQVLFVFIPSGNGGPFDVDADPPEPCSLPSPNVLCVTTSSPNDGLDCGAFGATTVDVAAPTRNSVTTANGGGFGGTGCATSYASPTVAGLATLLFGLVPEASGAEVRQAIVQGARPVPAWTGKSVSGGILDALGAVNALQAMYGLEPPAEPTDTDADGVADTADACPNIVGTAANGCPAIERGVTLLHKPRKGRFQGRITPAGGCAAGQAVRIKRKRPGPDRVIATPTTAPGGGFGLKRDVPDGRYYAKVAARTVADAGNCSAARSPSVAVG